MLSLPTPASKTGASRGTSNPYCRYLWVQWRFIGCRQLKPRQPAGQVHSPVRALQVPTCRGGGRGMGKGSGLGWLGCTWAVLHWVHQAGRRAGGQAGIERRVRGAGAA